MKSSTTDADMIPILTGVGLAGLVLVVVAVAGIVTMLI